jgi:uncharacterized protein (DUF1330 family)
MASSSTRDIGFPVAAGAPAAGAGPADGEREDVVVADGPHDVVRTEAITALDGTPTKRIVVIAFDSIEKAKAWDASPAQKEVTDIRLKSTKSRSFIADGKIM